MADEKIIFSMVGVSKTFTNQKRVLNNIYLSFFYGAKIGIIGLNGSGKSTLMKIIAGIDKNFDGEVVFSPGYTVGYLEQEPRLDDSKTVREVVEEGCATTVALLKEYEENHKNGTSTFRTEEKYRIMFEGIACWPYLRATSTGLKSRGINMVTTIYADAFGFDYNTFDEMIRAYCKVPNAINLEMSRDKRIKLCKDNHVEGMLVHTNRSCKLWSGFMYEMSRQIGKACDIPVVSFDGDQADPRNFSEAQYDTRVQSLTEIMEANKAAKGV